MLENQYRRDVLHIIQRTQILSSNRVLIAGSEMLLDQIPDMSIRECQQSPEVVVNVIEALCARLYKIFYIRQTTDETKVNEKTNQVEDNLIEQLKVANGTAEAWDPGWEVYHFGSDGRAYVKRGDQSRIAWAGTYMLENWMGAGAKIGDIVRLKIFPYTQAPLESFFHTFGASLADQFDEYKLLRFYFNVKAYAVVDLLKFLSQQLNHYKVPYHFKALADPASYDRSDAAVLYVASCHYQIVSSLLSELPMKLDNGLRDEVPMLTKAWATGIGVAQDPGHGASFGMHRCRLIAVALFDAWITQVDSVEDKLALVEHGFLKQGLSLDKPYLNSGEFDLFAQSNFKGGVQR